MIDRTDRLRGGLYGLLIGDALGVPYEFHRADRIPAVDLIEMTPPAGFSRSHRGVPPGTWSDDGAQALCLLASLLEKDHLDLDDLGARLVAWYEEGTYAVDGRVFDVGVQSSQAIRALMGGAAPATAGPTGELANGNGSLMRVLPLALWHRGSDAELVRDAELQSAVTHGHPRSKLCCALYCLWARRMLEGHESPWVDAVRVLRADVAGRPPAEEHAAAEALEMHIRPDEAPVGRGSGYVVDCLRSARMLEATGASFEATVRGAIALGDDTDTTACVTGGIVGIRDGGAAIPRRWLEALRGRDIVDPLLDALLARSEK